MKLLKKLFGTKHDRDVRMLRPMVARINALEEDYQGLSEDTNRVWEPTDRERWGAPDGRARDIQNGG